MDKILLYLLLCWLPFDAFTQGTDQLDIDFGNQGISVVDYQTFESLSAMAIQQDGKIVAVGYTEENYRSKIAVLRYFPDGSRDDSFGNQGAYYGQLQPISNVATAVALQADGKILVAGYCLSDLVAGRLEDLFLLRLTVQGVLDSTFSDDGVMVYHLSKNERAVAVKIGPDNKIYVAGNNFKGNVSAMLLLRYNMDGSVDTGFGSAGHVILNISGSTWNYCYNMDIDADGKILMIGEAIMSFSAANFTLIRLNQNGTLDITFSTDGKVTTSLGTNDDVPFALELLADGKILLGGYSVGLDNRTNFAMVQYLHDGALDNNFGSFGKVITPAGNGYGSIVDLCFLPDGEILALGNAKNKCSGFDFAIAKFNSSGALKTDFADQGFLYTDFDQHSDGISAATLLPDGKVLVAGTGVNTSNSISEFLLARYVFDINVGSKDLSNLVNKPKVFPNPVMDGYLTMQFNLLEASDIKLELFSAEGKFVGSLLEMATLPGPQETTFQLPAGLAKGYYFAGISTKKDRVFIPIIVQ